MRRTLTGQFAGILMVLVIANCSQIAAATDLGRRLAGNEAKLVFQEDFANPESMSHFVFAAPEHWKRVRVGDRFALEHSHAGNAYQPPHRSPHNIALIKGQQYGSFVLEYEAQQTGKEYGHRDACVFFNFVDPAHYYYTHIATKSDPHAHQIFIVNDAPRTKITGMGTDGFDWQSVDDWHKIRVVRDLESGEIEIYVDQMERPIMTATDKTHAWGYLGVGSFDDTGRVTNIRVYADVKRDSPTPFFRAIP
ncbi:MAG: hypothetical protein KDA92_00355 [Planctomycetales bacterium]|nr:hypothetical protein [Planctomycetales bacterium]MCA9167650.1 hypothetical protein [Planctomycetales bacterium]